MMVHSRNRVALVSLVLAAFAVASCSSGGGDSNGGGLPASTELTTSIVEYSFTPDTWKVPAGEQITITITNDGTLQHEWVLLQDGARISTEAEFEEGLVNVEQEVAPGETQTLTFEAPPAGTYQVICAIPGHFDAGLQGVLNSEG